MVLWRAKVFYLFGRSLFFSPGVWTYTAQFFGADGFTQQGAGDPNGHQELLWGLAPTCCLHSEDQFFCLWLNIPETFWVDYPDGCLSSGVRLTLLLSNSTDDKPTVGLNVYPLSKAKAERNATSGYQLLLLTISGLVLSMCPRCPELGQALAPSQTSAELLQLLAKPRERHGEVSKSDGHTWMAG